MAEQMIYKAISKTMQDVGVVGKDDFNQMQKFKFRGIDAVMNALNPAMIKNGIFVVPQVLEQTREDRVTTKGANLIYSICRIKYTFYAEDGSFVEAITVGEGMDSGDKATNKAMAIAFKYACFQVFCIPTEEMKDPDGECHEVQSNKIDEIKVKSLRAISERKGIPEQTICSRYKISSFGDMTMDIYIKAMNALEKSPDKAS